VIGEALTVAPEVRLVDGTGAVVARSGVAITVAVAGGSGTLSGTVSRTTDSHGYAAFPGLAFTGAAEGSRSLVFTSPGLEAAASTAILVSAAPLAERFDIQLQFISSATTAQRAAFEQAKARIEQIVVGDVPAATLHADAACGETPVSGTVDDLLIVVDLSYIDGAGNVLGQAGPCLLRQSKIPVVGRMQFDSADLAGMERNGTLGSVILHEMLHVLGFGTMWPSVGLVTGTTTTNPVFTGAWAREAFLGWNGGMSYSGTPVPVEGTGGDGTKNSHWRDTVFRSELMTGWISGSSQPLSRTTVESLRDYGYVVDPTKADAFDLASASLLSSFEAVTPLDLSDDHLPIEIRMIDESGAVVPLR
jgi:hypothetical protein